jgi:hypothetical protein
VKFRNRDQAIAWRRRSEHVHESQCGRGGGGGSGFFNGGTARSDRRVRFVNRRAAIFEQPELQSLERVRESRRAWMQRRRRRPKG